MHNKPEITSQFFIIKLIRTSLRLSVNIHPCDLGKPRSGSGRAAFSIKFLVKNFPSKVIMRQIAAETFFASCAALTMEPIDIIIKVLL